MANALNKSKALFKLKKRTKPPTKPMGRNQHFENSRASSTGMNTQDVQRAYNQLGNVGGA